MKEQLEDYQCFKIILVKKNSYYALYIIMQKFNEEICTESSFLIIGDNREYIASLCKDIMKNIDSYGIIITPHKDDLYTTIVPNIFIHTKYNDSILDKVFHRQQLLIKKDQVDPKSYVILDNCFSEYSNTIKNLILNRQIIHVHPLIVTTNILFSETDISYDYTIIFKNTININELYTICNNYLIVQDFILFYNSLKDNECLIFYNNNVYKHTVTNLSLDMLKSCEKFNRHFSHMMK